MGTNDQRYLTIETIRKTVTVDVDSEVSVRSSGTVSTDPTLADPSADPLGIYVSIGPLSMSMSTEEAMNLAAALAETATFFREKKAAALAHYQQMARNAQQVEA